MSKNPTGFSSRMRLAASGRLARAWSGSLARHDRALLAAILLLCVLVRIPFAALDLTPHMDLDIFRRWIRLAEEGGLTAMYGDPDVNYPPLALYLFSGAGWLAARLASYPGAAEQWQVLLIKLPALTADVLTAWVIARAYRRHSPALGAAAAAAYGLNPAIWYVSAYWAQVDSIYTLFIVAAILSLERGAVVRGWLAWTLGVLSKPQSLAVAPVLSIVTLQRRGWRGLAGALGASGALAVLLSLPWLLAGRGQDLLELVLNQPMGTPRVDVTGYNLWYLVLGSRVHNVGSELHPLDLPFTYQTAGIVLIGVYALVVMVLISRQGEAVLGATALTLGLFMLPTEIHERYLFPALAFVLLAARERPGLWFVFAILSATFFFNLVTIVPFTPALGINLIVVEVTSAKILVLKIGSLIAAGLNLGALGWVTWELKRGRREVSR